MTIAGRPHVVAERYVLASDVVLVATRAVVMAGHARVRRRTLRPVQPLVLDDDVLGGVIARRQIWDQRLDRARVRINLNDPRRVVADARCAARALVRVTGEQPTTARAIFEGETNGWTIGLESAAI